MGDECCQGKEQELSKLQVQQTQVLWTVLWINFGMFFLEFLAGIRGGSLSLTGDSLDMFGDALVYASSLYVINKGHKAQANAAFLKGLMMFGFAIAVFTQASYQFFVGTAPTVKIMGIFGLLALIANLVSLSLLTRHRQDNLNMSSVWLCSRNDIIANVSVLAAAGVVWLTHSPIPDLVVGMCLAVLFAKSAGKVLWQSWEAIQNS